MIFSAVLGALAVYFHQSVRSSTQQHTQSIQLQRHEDIREQRTAANNTKLYTYIDKLEKGAEAASARETSQLAENARLTVTVQKQSREIRTFRALASTHCSNVDHRDRIIKGLESELRRTRSENTAEVVRKIEEITRRDEVIHSLRFEIVATRTKSESVDAAHQQDVLRMKETMNKMSDAIESRDAELESLQDQRDEDLRFLTKAYENKFHLLTRKQIRESKSLCRSAFGAGWKVPKHEHDMVVADNKRQAASKQEELRAKHAQAMEQLEKGAATEKAAMKTKHENALANSKSQAAGEKAIAVKQNGKVANGVKDQLPGERATMVAAHDRAKNVLKNQFAAQKTKMEAEHNAAVDNVKRRATSDKIKLRQKCTTSQTLLAITRAEFKQLKAIHARCNQIDDRSEATGDGMDMDDTEDGIYEAGPSMDIDHEGEHKEPRGQGSDFSHSDNMAVDPPEQADTDAGDAEMAMEVLEHEVALRDARDGKRKA